MSLGLPVSRLVNVTINLAPLAAQFANFGALLIVGDSNVIDVNQRIRQYNSLSGVVADFGTTTPEYAAADLFFSQSPQPAQLYIGRWASVATAGLLRGGVLSGAQQALTNFTSITNGSMKVNVDGTLITLGSMNFSSALNLNGVASIITTALTGPVCQWNGSQFTITSTTTGTTSSVGYAQPTGSGTDVSTLLQLTSALASTPVMGIAAESALAAVGVLDNLPTSWYGLMFATPTIQNSDHLAVAAYIQGAGNAHIYGVATTDTTVLDSTSTTDIASELQAASYTRSFVQYSAAPYTAASFFGRAFTVDFNANNTTITLMYKQEPGVVPENLTQSQATTLQSKRCNFFVTYNNGTQILQDGVMSGPAFFDEIHGLDWLQNQIQTNVWNLLYTSTTKIPQTDAGSNQIKSAIEAACVAGVNNGLIAPGTWSISSPGFGTLKPGDYLAKGFYVYAPTVASQADANRQARQSVPFQVAVKLAGAVHSSDIIVNVNR